MLRRESASPSPTPTDQILAARAIFDTYLAPLMKKLLGWWEGLGEEGKAKIVRLVMTISGIGAALLGVGAAAAILGPIISGIITVGSGLVSFLAPAALGALAQNLLLLGAAAYAVFRVFREEGEGPLEFVKRMFDSLITTVVSVATYVWDLVAAFGTGLGGSAFAAFGEAIDSAPSIQAAPFDAFTPPARPGIQAAPFAPFTPPTWASTGIGPPFMDVPAVASRYSAYGPAFGHRPGPLPASWNAAPAAYPNHPWAGFGAANGWKKSPMLAVAFFSVAMFAAWKFGLFK